MYQEFTRSPAKKDPPIPSGEEARRDLALVLAAYESAWTGGKIWLE